MIKKKNLLIKYLKKVYLLALRVGKDIEKIIKSNKFFFWQLSFNQKKTCLLYKAYCLPIALVHHLLQGLS